MFQLAKNLPNSSAALVQISLTTYLKVYVAISQRAAFYLKNPSAGGSHRKCPVGLFLLLCRPGMPRPPSAGGARPCPVPTRWHRPAGNGSGGEGPLLPPAFPSRGICHCKASSAISFNSRESLTAAVSLSAAMPVCHPGVP